MSTNDGGPAYPDNDPAGTWNKGMSLREAFAAAVAGDVLTWCATIDPKMGWQHVAINVLDFAQALTDGAIRRREETK